MLLCPKQLFPFLLQSNSHHPGGPHAHVLLPPRPGVLLGSELPVDSAPSENTSQMHWFLSFSVPACLPACPSPGLRAPTGVGPVPSVRFADHTPAGDSSMACMQLARVVSVAPVNARGSQTMRRTEAKDLAPGKSRDTVPWACQSLNNTLGSTSITASSQRLPNIPSFSPLGRGPVFSGSGSPYSRNLQGLFPQACGNRQDVN